MLTHTTPDKLLGLLDAGSHAPQDSSPGWLPEDYAGIWQHLVRSPLVAIVPCDIESVNAAKTITISGILKEANPPYEFVRLLARYAKSRVRDGAMDLPSEIARVLYFLMVWVGRHRCNREDISTLPDAGLRDGIEWAGGCEWLDAPTRALITTMQSCTRKSVARATSNKLTDAARTELAWHYPNMVHTDENKRKR